MSKLMAKINPLVQGAIAASKPKLRTSRCYAKVKLIPSTPTGIPQIVRGFTGMVCDVRTGAWKQLTISKAWSSSLGKIELGSKSSEEQAEQKKRNESQLRATKWGLVAIVSVIGGCFIYAVNEYGPPQLDEDGNVIEDEFISLPQPKQNVMRTIHAIRNYNETIKAPSRELLLPGPLEAPYYQPPYTLVIEMTGILVHPDWTYKTGWRFKKRPYINYFLQQCGPPLYEVVIFTQEQGFTAFPLIDSLDPNGYIMHRLFRDSTRYINGVRVKDLNCLNRDLRRVIYVDWNKEAGQLNRSNCLTIKKWSGDDEDKSLFDLAHFLRAVAIQGIEDVREVIAHYSQFDDPLEAFKENQRRLLDQEEELKKQTVTTPSSFINSWKRK